MNTTGTAHRARRRCDDEKDKTRREEDREREEEGTGVAACDHQGGARENAGEEEGEDYLERRNNPRQDAQDAESEDAVERSEETEGVLDEEGRVEREATADAEKTSEHDDVHNESTQIRTATEDTETVVVDEEPEAGDAGDGDDETAGKWVGHVREYDRGAVAEDARVRDGGRRTKR